MGVLVVQFLPNAARGGPRLKKKKRKSPLLLEAEGASKSAVGRPPFARQKESFGGGKSGGPCGP